MRWCDPVLKSYMIFFFPWRFFSRSRFSQCWPFFFFFFFPRCQWINHCLPSPGPAWKRLSTSGRSVGLDSNVPVLVRGGQDGFYYRGTVKEEIEVSDGFCAIVMGMCNRVSSPPAVLTHHLSLVLQFWFQLVHEIETRSPGQLMLVVMSIHKASNLPDSMQSSLPAAWHAGWASCMQHSLRHQ